ncbi:sensor histidine kinase [Yinghuangia seranimata]|uniref:sensor histidine kinase n=1 Tax=Yinghuangia seranimata TaxID=408067 RepID=UPI00248B7BB4|nr:histidine kinase [Yinghuangia seranimata]MDI2131981.1 histidine kinase [Yinghuangia seranimata]
MQGQEITTALRRAVRPVAAAAWTGHADPLEPRPWSGRWAARWPFRVVSPRAASIGGTLLLAFALLSITAQSLYERLPNYSPQTLFPTALVLVLPLVLRLWHPLGAWRISLLSMLFAGNQHWPGSPYVVGGAVVFLLLTYTVAVRCERAVTIGAAILTLAGVWFTQPSTALPAAVVVLVPLLAGYNTRVRRLGARELAEREELHREQRAVLAERQRIAREMHDVVAHHMSVIAIQAEAAPYRVADPDPVLAKSFADIRANALAGLADLRRILGVLREEGTGPETAPQPGLDRLDDLMANARAAGLTVSSTVDGKPVPLDDAVGLAAYRILQEALSNAMKHAPGSRVDVDVAYRARSLDLTVANTPPPEPSPAPPGGSGQGLLGMRERAASLGGTFAADPTSDGGFRVAASLPLTPVEAP